MVRWFGRSGWGGGYLRTGYPALTLDYGQSQSQAGMREIRRKRAGIKTYTSVAAATASSTPLNPTTAHLVGSNGANLSVASVTIPNVPSAPMNNLVVSNPALDFRARWRVLITSPEGSTTVYMLISISLTASPPSPRAPQQIRKVQKDLGGKRTKFKNHSALAVPYRTALVPLHPVPHIPPIVAPGPGSSGKNRGIPCSFKWALRSSHLTPGCTITSPSASDTRRILSIRDTSIEIPPYGYVCQLP